MKSNRFLRSYWPLLAIIVISGFLLFLRLNRDWLWDWDECIYAQYAKTMKITGNFLTNFWLHQPRLEKPPLYMWLLQLPFSFGVNEFTARFLSVLSFLTLVSSVYLFSKKFLSEKIAIIAVLLLFISNTFMTYTTKVNTDILYTLFIFLGFCSWVLSEKKSQYGYLSGIFFGLAIMVKGLGIGVFLIAIALSVFINFKRRRLTDFFKMITAMTIVIAPWHMYEYLTYGRQFIQVYIIENIIQKVKYPVEFHFGGRLYYILLILKEFFPWIIGVLILPVYILILLKKINFAKFSIKKISEKNQILLLLFLLVLLSLISITQAKTKIAWYVMPFYPFLTILLAYSLEFILLKLRKYSSAAIFTVIVVLSVQASFSLYQEVQPLRSKREVSPRNEIISYAKNYPYPTIDYLVQKSERTAKDLLNQSPSLYTSTTFVYGGNACAVYYSNKDVNYYYSPDEFLKRLNKGNGFYLIENGDFHYLKNSAAQIVYKNSDFTLLKN